MTAKPKLIIVYNGTPAIEYDRNKPLPEQQSAYLDRMDQKMDNGFEIAGTLVSEPDTEQRLEFVASQLYHALINENDPIIAAMCSYIATRSPEAQQLIIIDNNGPVSIEISMEPPGTPRMDGIPVTLN